MKTSIYFLLFLLLPPFMAKSREAQTEAGSRDSLKNHKQTSVGSATTEFLHNKENQANANVTSMRDTIIVLPEKHAMKKSAIYTEILGNSATFMSINYDYVFNLFKKFYLNSTIGFGTYYFTRIELAGFNIPFSLNVSTPAHSNHHFEAGIGFGINKVFDNKKQFNFSRILFNYRIGYKYQRPQGGYYFRAGVTPISPLHYFSYGSYVDPYTIFDNKANLSNLDLILHSLGVCFGFSF